MEKLLLEAIELLQRSLDESVLADTSRSSFYFQESAFYWKKDVQQFLEKVNNVQDKN